MPHSNFRRGIRFIIAVFPLLVLSSGWHLLVAKRGYPHAERGALRTGRTTHIMPEGPRSRCAGFWWAWRANEKTRRSGAKCNLKTTHPIECQSQQVPFGGGAEQLNPLVSMQEAVLLTAVAMAPLSKIIATASAVPTMARIITYSAAAAPRWSFPKSRK